MEPTTESAVTSTATEDERYRHNDDLPVHHLPPELLCSVFKYFHRKRAYRGLFIIRSVCKYWLEIVDSSPELWTFISLTHNDNLLDMILQKSKNNLLSIEYDDGRNSFTPEVPREKTTAFLERVIPLVGRWESLHFAGTDHDRVLGLPLQSLETLVISSLLHRTHHAEPLHAPRLRYLDLWGISINWESLSDLCAITINWPAQSPAINQVYLMFNACPRLNVFAIEGRRMSDSGISDLPSAQVFLPHLQYLLLFDVSVASYSRLLSLIDAPNLRRLVVFRGFSPYMDDPDPMFEPAARFFGSYTHSIDSDRDYGRLRISGSRHTFAISVGTCKVVFKSPHIWTWKGDRQDCLTNLSAALSGFDRRVIDSVKVIHFGGTRVREDLITLGPILQHHFPNVEELVVTLSLSERRPDAHLVLEALKSPSSLKGEARWLFPGLTTLHLKACREPICDGVLGVVEARRNGAVQAIQRVSIKNGRIERNTEAKLKVGLQEFRLAGTRYFDTVS
ncbi:hypothetical protein M407DRAFT_17681 [Tulasnella calospora MUT 4182]|uniref:F-box domain-containing protein n=1 Tax=Tulasnella calospora MUT 4182 TaxID=1051891 RepID=A0A0C3QL71_9AGAM|nr:hypothetical protein M407DRAFT_17681 [Tulasnella calospora MUT 4182]